MLGALRFDRGLRRLRNESFYGFVQPAGWSARIHGARRARRLCERREYRRLLLLLSSDAAVDVLTNVRRNRAARCRTRHRRLLRLLHLGAVVFNHYA